MGDSEKEKVGGASSIDDVTVEELAVKTAKPARSSKKSGKTGFFTSIKAEFKKIIWPNRRSLGKQTIAVILCSVVLGLIIALVDLVIRFGLEFIIK